MSNIKNNRILAWHLGLNHCIYGTIEGGSHIITSPVVQCQVHADFALTIRTDCGLLLELPSKGLDGTPEFLLNLAIEEH